MAQQIKLKRSAVAGKVPTTASLATGEIAINTNDGKLFFKRGDDTIQTIVTTNTTVTGSLDINGPITGSDIQIDDWGSVSASLAAVNSGVGALTLQTVTDTGNTTTKSITAASYSGSYIDLTPLATGDLPAYKDGRLFYDADNGAVSFYNEEADISLQIGQEFYIKVKNDTASPIPNGTPVQIVGASGDNVRVAPAIAEDHTTGTHYDNHIIGLATHDITGSGQGYVTTEGVVRGIDTSDFSAGDVLYLQTGSAGFRNTPPPFPYDTVQIGYVQRVQQNNGEIYVKPSEPVHFNNISGLSGSVSGPGDLWVYQANNSWAPTKTLSGSYTINNGNLVVDGDVDSNDITIDQWGSVSASLASIETGTAALSLDDVTTVGASTSNDITVGDVTINDWGSVSASLATVSSQSAVIPTLDQITSAGNTTANSIEVANLTVNGTGSFGYIQSVTGSVKYFGDAYIVLNANAPTERYAGIRVFDSGSTGETGSLEYDSIDNHWFYESANEGYASVFMSGPKASRGALTVPTSGSLVLAVGNHLYSSNVSDLNGQVTIDSDAVINGDITHDTYSVLQSGKVTVNNATTGTIGGTYSGTTYAGAVVDYVLYDAGRNNQRTGTVLVTANSTTVVHSENVTTDIGNTDAAQVTTSINTGNFTVDLVNNIGTPMYVTYNIKLLKV
jgi:hypothetical protein